MSDNRKRVEARLQVHFEGDYLATDELLLCVDNWIDRGFCDRDDLRGYRLDGVTQELSAEQSEYLTEVHPVQERWMVETWDAEQWNPAGRKLDTRDEAADYRSNLHKRFPDMRMRLVRTQTTYMTDETGEN